MRNVRETVLSLAIGVVIGVAGIAGATYSPPAAAFACANCASEWTQILNNIQLMQKHAKQIQQVAYQVKQYEQQLKALRQLDPQKLKGMLRGVAGEIAGAEVVRQIEASQKLTGTLSSLEKNMDKIYRAQATAAEVAELLKSRGKNISPNDYIGMFKALAKLRQDTYGQRLEQLTQAVDDAQSDIKRAEAIAATAPQIQTNVEGFGALLQSNSVMVSQLGGLRQTLAETQAMNARQARELAEEVDKKRLSEMAQRDWVTRQLVGDKKD